MSNIQPSPDYLDLAKQLLELPDQPDAWKWALGAAAADIAKSLRVLAQWSDYRMNGQ